MRKLIYGALMAAIAFPMFQSCIDDSESLSVKEVREEKANELKSLADLNAAQAEAQKTIAEAQKTAAEAQKTIAEAQAALLENQAALVATEDSLRKVEIKIALIDLQIAQTQDSIQKEKLEQEKIQTQILQYDLWLKAEQLRRNQAENNYRIAQLDSLTSRLAKETELKMQQLANDMTRAKIDELELAGKYLDALEANENYEANKAKAQLAALMAAYKEAAAIYYDLYAQVNKLNVLIMKQENGWAKDQEDHADLLASNDATYATAAANVVDAKAQLEEYKNYIEENGAAYDELVDAYNQAVKEYRAANDIYNNFYENNYLKSNKAFNEASWNLNNSYYFVEGVQKFLNYFYAYNGSSENPEAGYIYTEPVEENGVYTVTYYAYIPVESDDTEDNGTATAAATTDDDFEKVTLFTYSYSLIGETYGSVDGVDYDHNEPVWDDWGDFVSWSNNPPYNYYPVSQTNVIDFFTIADDGAGIEQFLKYVNALYYDSPYSSVNYYEGQVSVLKEQIALGEETLADAKTAYDAALTNMEEAYTQSAALYQDYLDAVEKYDFNGEQYDELAEAYNDAVTNLNELKGQLSSAESTVNYLTGEIGDAEEGTGYLGQVETLNTALEEEKAATTPNQAEISRLQGEIAAYNELIGLYQSKLKAANAEVASLKSQVAAAETEKENAQKAFLGYNTPSVGSQIVNEYYNIWQSYVYSDYQDAWDALYQDQGWDDENDEYVYSVFYKYQQWASNETYLVQYPWYPNYEETEIVEVEGYNGLGNLEEFLAEAEENLENVENGSNSGSVYAILMDAYQMMQDQVEKGYIAPLVSAYNTAAAQWANDEYTYYVNNLNQQAANGKQQALWNLLTNYENRELGNSLAEAQTQITNLELYIPQQEAVMAECVANKEAYTRNFNLTWLKRTQRINLLKSQLAYYQDLLDRAKNDMDAAKSALEAAAGDSTETTPAN